MQNTLYTSLFHTHTYIYFIVYEILITRELTVFGLDDVARYCLHGTAVIIRSATLKQ